MKLFSKQIQLFLWILFLFFLSTNKIWSHDIRLPDYFREEETSSYLNFKLNQDFSALVRFPTKIPDRTRCKHRVSFRFYIFI
ncbi:hypothetical protein LEP1GSC073_0208 [Leptospira noguchii str. Cascata]|nr:hypothetical protein LEP1GSC073_0208 [Leptospira noguchii str. Cascata]